MFLFILHRSGGVPGADATRRRPRLTGVGEQEVVLVRQVVAPGKRLLLVPLLLVSLLGLTASPANADYIFQKGVLATWNDFCTEGRAETSHGAYGGGYWKTDTLSRQKASYVDVNCILPMQRPAGFIAANVIAYRWTGTTWAVCFNQGYKFNTSNIGAVTLAVQTYGWNPPCGAGYYGQYGVSYVKDNGLWFGDQIWSGYHSLPSH